ncbi:MAG TPA: hypothetical protein VNN76_01765 [Bacteroidota bacterium]|nr:hypothetical protein [Bacteroidota bacterium]
MATLTTSAILFGLCYYALKTFYRAWSKSALPAWSRPVTGLLAWGVLLSFAGIVVGVADPIADLLTNPNEAAAYKIAGLAIVISAVWKYVVDNPEVLDFAHMKPFIREALAFRNLRLRRVNIFEELDKHEVRRIYRETTGKELHLKAEDDPFLRKMHKRHFTMQRFAPTKRNVENILLKTSE